MAIHLVTTVGGDGWRTLEPMLCHYRGLGVDAFHVTLHLAEDDDSAREPVTEIMHRFGCPLYDTVTGNWSVVQQETYIKPRREYPRDWFILADSDELHHYPASPADLARECESNEWECVYGGFVDRIAADGGIPEIDAARSLEEQFPLGARLSDIVAQTNIQKVTLVRGALWVWRGQHFAPYAKFCPLDVAAVPVFHYKWHSPLIQMLQKRRDFLREGGEAHWEHSHRLLDHVEMHGGINLEDPALRVAPCAPDYPHWNEVVEAIKARFAAGGSRQDNSTIK